MVNRTSNNMISPNVSRRKSSIISYYSILASEISHKIPSFGKKNGGSFISSPEEHKANPLSYRKHSRMKDRIGKIATGNAYNVFVNVVPPNQAS
jgi:hypothetical protein